MRLDRVSDGSEAVARRGRFDCKIERVFGIAKQCRRLFRNLANPVGPGGVAVIPSQNRTHVDGDDVTFAQPATPRDSVNDLIIYGGTHVGWKAVITKERRNGA